MLSKFNLHVFRCRHESELYCSRAIPVSTMASNIRIGTASFFIAASINATHSMLNAVQKHLIMLSKCFRINETKDPMLPMTRWSRGKPLKYRNTLDKYFHHPYVVIRDRRRPKCRAAYSASVLRSLCALFSVFCL